MADGGDGAFRSALLAGLDARGRADVRAMARVRRLPEGGVAFTPGDPADTLWFVTSGSVALVSRRGTRELAAPDHFGSEALVRGARRTSHALARAPSALLEIPALALERILARTGAAALLAREGAAARRQALASLLFDTPFGQALGDAVLEGLVDKLREEPLGRGARLFEVSDRARAAYIVASGLIELVTAGGERVYAARGDVVGLEQARAEAPYGAAAAALGDAVVWLLPTPTAQDLAAKHPNAVARAEAAWQARQAQQRRIPSVARGLATRHAGHELERLASAGSLLAIELDRCVRCGECTRACAGTHGTPRLERRGEKAVVALRTDGVFTLQALLLPRACQHCEDPACLPECPTGAITRDATGVVVLREDLCTGCGACAKACPWDAIRLAPRASPEHGAGACVATKCDLCRGNGGPACVEACPTGAILRADPDLDVAGVGSLLGAAPKRTASARSTAQASGLRVISYAALVPPAVALIATAGRARTARELIITGTFAGFACVALLGHGVLKRFPAIRRWIRRRVPLAERRGTAPFVQGHVVTAVVAGSLVLAHAGFATRPGVAGSLAVVFWGLTLSGAFGAAVYRALPARLTRLERHGTLPEDRRGEREALEQRLYGTLSAQDGAVKELARRVFLPYARSSSGALALIASGRSLREEEAVLTARIERLLGGRKRERITASGELVEVAVALRALAARSLLEGALGAWLPLHVVLSVVLVALLVVHVVGALR